MNKLVKGSIAGAAGIALLLGGASTFALWNDSITSNAGSVSSGELRIADSTTPGGGWTDVSPSGIIGSTTLPTTTTGTAPNQVITVTPKIVPGDKWRYTRQIVLTTTGKNLLADLTFDPTSITNGLPAGEFTYTFTATPVVVAPAGTSASLVSNGTNSFRVTPGTASTTTVNVTVDIEFTNITAAGGNLTAGQAKTINVSALKFNLAQVRA